MKKAAMAIMAATVLASACSVADRDFNISAACFSSPDREVMTRLLWYDCEGAPALTWTRQCNGSYTGQWIDTGQAACGVTCESVDPGAPCSFLCLTASGEMHETCSGSVIDHIRY